jgi:hypothetical protein
MSGATQDDKLRRLESRVEEFSSRLEKANSAVSLLQGLLRRLEDTYTRFPRFFQKWVGDRPVKLLGQIRLQTEADGRAICSECGREFVRRDHPVVALDCGNFYHRECFAALMAAAETCCPDWICEAFGH